MDMDKIDEKALKPVGFFRELPHGNKAGQSLAENVSDIPHENEEAIINYLKRGAVLFASPGIMFDILDVENERIINDCNIYTDGVWMWCGDLSYYVSRYHVKLPEEFIENIKAFF
ncbi:MAG: hypothetical protein ACM3KR_08570 [Deltaproteobacteria bacterium]